MCELLEEQLLEKSHAGDPCVLETMLELKPTISHSDLYKVYSQLYLKHRNDRGSVAIHYLSLICFLVDTWKSAAVSPHQRDRLVDDLKTYISQLGGLADDARQREQRSRLQVKFRALLEAFSN